MKLLSWLFCEDIRQEIGNKFSALGIFGDQITLQLIPGQTINWPIRLRLFSLIRLAIEKDDLQPTAFNLRVISNGKTLHSIRKDIPPSTPLPKKYLNLNMDMSETPIENAGILQFELEFFSKEKSIAKFSPPHGLEIKTADISANLSQTV